ncbi:interleukin-12 subunit alpha [Nerophis lumbriciformis]|uniref:interleukin-12 subunit alpha n=1 Tax=Nerophis lumbriciformis TaxID=546530 RepID=UPI002ADF12B4|nr:interleukin-12 subunit alpha-like [Nerophis lumbriciformis]
MAEENIKPAAVTWSTRRFWGEKNKQKKPQSSIHPSIFYRLSLLICVIFLSFYSDFLSCLLLTSTLQWRACTSLPARHPSAPNCATCSTLFRSLLVNIAELLKSEIVCYSITSEKVTVSSSSDTLRACAPRMHQNSSCMVYRDSSFSESECLMNIKKDMLHYHAVIQSYLNSADKRRKEPKALLLSTLKSIQDLQENCSPIANKGQDLAEENTYQMWGSDSFKNRLEMCKMMRGFYIRAITINRAMGYISAGDHRK